jgi:hypothetical protein
MRKYLLFLTLFCCSVVAMAQVDCQVNTDFQNVKYVQVADNAVSLTWQYAPVKRNTVFNILGERVGKNFKNVLEYNEYVRSARPEGFPVFPRIVLMVDEAQEMFTKNTANAKTKLIIFFIFSPDKLCHLSMTNYQF